VLAGALVLVVVGVVVWEVVNAIDIVKVVEEGVVIVIIVTAVVIGALRWGQ
jgi:hypothetical protein